MKDFINDYVTIDVTTWGSILAQFISVGSTIVLLHAFRRKRATAKIPSNLDIPISMLKHTASKETLRDLSGKVDIAVIGSGIGGLASAALLSKFGYKVAVFEQHSVAGGSTHTYEDTKENNDFQFDVGVHYVGLTAPLRRVFDFLSDGNLEWVSLSRTYDVMYNDTTKQTLDVTSDLRSTRKNLMLLFPDLNKNALNRYDRACFLARLTCLTVWFLKLFPRFVLKILWPLVAPVYCWYAARSTKDVMTACGLPDDVIGALTYHYGNIGTPPDRSAFLMQAVLEGHYREGAYFPRGGSSSIAKALVSTIARHGGYVFTISSVKQILTKEKRSGSFKAIGVRVHGVDVFVKKFVISDAGFQNTFGQRNIMKPKEDTASQDSALLIKDACAKQRAMLEKNMIDLEPSPSFLCLFVGLDATDQDLDLPAQNVWHLKDWRHDISMRHFLSAESLKEVEDDIPFFFLGMESAKDPEFAVRHPGKSTVSILCPAKYKWFEKWNGTSTKHRGAEYDEIKSRITSIMLRVLYQHFPNLVGHVIYTDLGTPLSVNKYLGRQAGEVYSLDHTPERFGRLEAQLALHPQTIIENLCMTGQDVLSVSVVASTLSGLYAASRIAWLAQIYSILATIRIAPTFVAGT